MCKSQLCRADSYAGTRARQKGFTLVELIVTVSLAAIVLMFAVPSFSELISNTRLTTLTNDLVTHIHLARSEAVKRRMAITLCSSDDGATCSGNTDWGAGWILFTDRGKDRSIDTDDELIRVKSETESGPSLKASHAHLSYLPDGTVAVQ